MFVSLWLLGGCPIVSNLTDPPPVPGRPEAGEPVGPFAPPSGPPDRSAVTIHAVSDDVVGLGDPWLLVHDAGGAVLFDVEMRGQTLRLADVPEGGFVTLAYGVEEWRQLETFADVSLGDELWFSPAHPALREPVGSVTIVLEDPPPASASGLTLVSGCGLPAYEREPLTFPLTAQVSIDAACAGRPSVDVMVLAYQDGWTAPRAVASVADVPLAATDDGLRGVVRLDEGDWDAGGASQIVRYVRDGPEAHVTLIAHLLKNAYVSGAAFVAADQALADGSGLSVTLPAPVGFYDEVVAQLRIVEADDDWRWSTVQVRQSLAGALTLRDSDVPPLPGVLEVDPGPPLTVSQELPESWSCGGELPNSAIVRRQGGNFSTDRYTWTIYGPPGAIWFPDLPADLTARVDGVSLADVTRTESYAVGATDHVRTTSPILEGPVAGGQRLLHCESGTTMAFP